jgi:dUTP pyrophosphatase
MERTKISFVPLHKAATMPKTHSLGAAGYDLFSICDGVVPPLSTVGVKLGFSLHLPSNLVGILCGRSGIGKNHGVTVINSYVKSNDEITVYLKNCSEVPFNFEKGMRIAQLFFGVIDDLKLEEVNKAVQSN